MIDHLRNTQSVGLEDLAVLILDEADRLLEMGFSEEVRGWAGVNCGCVLKARASARATASWSPLCANHTPPAGAL